ncbi:MAG: CRISPR-associated endonuclease Cas3'' [Pseudohongiella sp.]|uniref:CRISPR-associated endonuclease Cas3'' n=1 Tax=Pseudohongiella sp. TaxID=1979412 RepID=UPI00349FEA42
MTQNPTYYAHSASGLPEADWQLLSEHLQVVGRLGAKKAAHFGASNLAEIVGLLHDVGKYCPEFQDRLRGSSKKVDHATWGAKIVLERYGELGKLLAYAIAGHHAGLADGREDVENRITPLANRLKRESETKLDPAWESEIPLPQDLNLPPFKIRQGQQYFQLAFLGRMIFSSLVDSDFLDTEAFYDRIEKREARNSVFPTIEELHAQLNKYLAQPKFNDSHGVNKIRAQILAEVKGKSAEEPGLFSLNVPTGGGKTLTSLAFSLDHAIKHGLRRVILVIPFTSIVEQNAAVFREALGPLGKHAVLEHHSAFSDDQRDYKDPDSRDKLRQAAENWEAPIIVTTAVQFFESLFANRSSRCRKLHNIANSVVILDEAQTLPLKLLRPCVAAISELALNYRTSAVLCTATQPALRESDGFIDGLIGVRDLVSDPQSLHQQLQRVSIKHIGDLTDDDLVHRVNAEHQVLCIVNNRRHARSLFDQIRSQDGAFHLTTLMCARHRSEQLDLIRATLKSGKPCRVVSTSLIEAGVDVDFPTVYRAEAGLDSIAQSAGRCNREGSNAVQDSWVYVFNVASDWNTPPELAQYAQACRSVFRQHESNPLALGAIIDYFREVYWLKEKELDAYELLSAIERGRVDGIPYEKIANKFRMIESNMKPVIVPYFGDGEAAGNAEVTRLCKELAYMEYPGRIAKKLQGYLVQVPEYGLQALVAAGAVHAINPQKFGDQFMELCKPDLYDPVCGLSWENPEFTSAEQSVI